MTPALIASLLGAAFFGAAGYLGTAIGASAAEKLPRFSDAPRPAEPPLLALVAGSALLGAVMTQTGSSRVHLLLLALLCAALVALWITDARRGIVPDAFTLIPLAILVAVAAVERRWWVPISAVLLFAPFAGAAVFSKGRGMGWGDVKLVSLGGAILGAQLAVPAFALACLIAGSASWLRGRRTESIALAPYLAAAIGAALPLASWR